MTGRVTDRSIGCESCTDQQKLFAAIEEVNYVSFSYDENNKSLDLFLRKKEMEWNNGVGLQLNNLTSADKRALQKFLDHGE